MQKILCMNSLFLQMDSRELFEKRNTVKVPLINTDVSTRKSFQISSQCTRSKQEMSLSCKKNIVNIHHVILHDDLTFTSCACFVVDIAQFPLYVWVHVFQPIGSFLGDIPPCGACFDHQHTAGNRKEWWKRGREQMREERRIKGNTRNEREVKI